MDSSSKNVYNYVLVVNLFKSFIFEQRRRDPVAIYVNVLVIGQASWTISL